MKKLVGARLDESFIERMDKLIDSSSKYRDRTHVIKVALEELLEKEGVTQNEQKTEQIVP